MSCKLIHGYLSRQLLGQPDLTLWSAFGGHPTRFGLEEFGTVTGLRCGPFPVGYHPSTVQKKEDAKGKTWKKLFGNKKNVTIASLCRQLERDGRSVGIPKMSGWKKLRLALIIIVDGVLIAHKQVPQPTPRYVRMLEHLPSFFQFPWGRESFLKTILCMKPPKFDPIKCPDPVKKLVRKLKQRTFRLQGFPLSLQLVAFRAIPQLLSYIHAEDDQLTIMDLQEGHLPQHPSINKRDILRAEFDPNVCLISYF